MLIACPNCTTSYDVSDASLGKSGRSVRCVRCRTVWFAATTGESALEPPKPLPMMGVVETPDLPEPGFAGMASAAAEEPPRAAAPRETAPAAPDFDFENQTRPVQIAPLDDLEEREGGFAASLERDDASGYAMVEAPPLVPPQQDAADGAVIDQAADEPPRRSTVGRRPRRRPTPQWRAMLRPNLTTVSVALAAVLAFVVIWRTDLTRVFPQVASLFSQVGLPVNTRGLVFDEVKMTPQDGGTVVVDGAITNVTDKPLDVPRLRFAWRDATGIEVATWTVLPPRVQLKPGERQVFHTQLGAAPPDGHDVMLRFFDRRDLPRS